MSGESNQGQPAGFGRRVARAAREAVEAMRHEGVRRTLAGLARRGFRRSTSVVYVMPGTPPGAVEPAALTIACVTADDRERCAADLRASGAADDLHLFARGAVCYIAYWDGVPVGAGWLFRVSYLLRKAGLGSRACYLGGFQVREAYRGRGIYPALLRAMCRDAAREGLVPYIDTTPDNAASRRGIVKAGFERCGTLRVVVVAGAIVHCRLHRAADADGTEGVKDFVMVANAWGSGMDNPTSKHRIALELARRGHRVLWVEGAGMRAPSVGSGPDRSRMARKVLAALRGARKVEGGGWRVGRRDLSQPSDNPQSSTFNLQLIWVLSPLFIPLPRYRFVRWLNGLIGAWSARVWCRLLGFKDPVLINYVPVLAGVMRWWGRGGGAQVVYHCVDRWDAFKMYDSAVMAEMDRRCCEYADVVIASASELRTRCLRWNPNTRLVTHGVDYEHFRKAVEGGGWKVEGGGEGLTADHRKDTTPNAQRPTSNAQVDVLPSSTVHLPPSTCDLPSGPIIGFFGLLSEWVDQALLLRLAREVPGAQLVLIGKADVDVTALSGVRNVHVLGARPFRDLPGYLARFTVGIIPFVVNDLTRAVNPIKLREMLSGGCPVVSTALPEVKAVEGCRLEMEDGRRQGVFVAEDHDAFVRMVAGLVERPLSADERRAVSAGMAGESWAGKVDEILSIISKKGDL